MSNFKNQLSYVTKPYNVVGKVSIYPLNEDGESFYFQNKIVENKIIKKYGTMNFLEKSEKNVLDDKLYREFKNDDDCINNLLENSKNFPNYKTNLYSINKAKTFTNWNEEFFRLKRKFKEDITTIDLKIKTLKNETKNNSTKNENPKHIHKKHLSCSEKKSFLIKEDCHHNCNKQEAKINLKLVNDFSPKKVPRINTGNQNTNIQSNFKLFLKDKYDRISDPKNFRVSTSNVSSKILDNWVDEENQKFKNLFLKIEPRHDKKHLPVLINKVVQPEINFNRNIKGDCKMMGDKYNPYNYYVDYTRHRKKRNFYGSIFNN